MEEVGLTDIDKEHFLVKYFHPEILYIWIDNGTLQSADKYEYYNPLIFIVDSFLKCKQLDNSNYFNTWHVYNLLRAIVYELFNYHFIFDSENYDDFSNFIRNNYNILGYHTPDKEWFDKCKTKPREETIRIKNAITINNALFWKSEKRNPVKYYNSTK